MYGCSWIDTPSVILPHELWNSHFCIFATMCKTVEYCLNVEYASVYKKLSFQKENEVEKQDVEKRRRGNTFGVERKGCLRTM